jgi:phosphate-selective porin OprO and OprP
MRSLTTYVVLLVFFTTLHSPAQTQEPADKTGAPASASASKEEVNELRSEVAAQRKTIEELKVLVEQLAASKPQVAETDSVETDLPVGDNVHLMNANLVQQAPPPKPPSDKKETPLTAGWNGEHFFIRSSDGKFVLQPYGYFQTDYRAYSGDGHPPDTFLIRRARFGFQGNYGKHYDFALLVDAAATNGQILRDLYVNARVKPEFQVQIGQFKEPFAQETLTGAANLDFVERSLASLLYPAAATSFRSPGVALHGDIDGGVMQWWAGAFNGKGILAPNTTDQPEFVGRLRFYPWRKKTDSLFQNFAFGGSMAFGRTAGISNELSFSGTLPDGAYTFFPQFRLNGPTQRYNGEMTWVHGPWAVRAEYDQLNQFRRNVGSEQSDALGFTSLPGVVSKAGYGQITYLLTGETRPENGIPRVKHPFLGPETAPGGLSNGWGAWELAFRYDSIEAHEPGINLLNNPLTPGFVTTFIDHTDEFTFGVNWYLNYWVKYQFNIAVDRLKEPSVLGQLPQDYIVFLNRIQFRF